MLRFHVDLCAPDLLAGWIDDNGPIEQLEVQINGKYSETIAANVYRKDLDLAGLGDGRRAYYLRPAAELKPGDWVLFKRDGRPLMQVHIGQPQPAPDGKVWFAAIAALAVDPQGPEAHDLSQQRWRADEPDRGLTFGRMMSGDALWDLYSKYRMPRARDHILEIGPGYGRLLATAVERRLRFASYTGVELSPARVKKLSEAFTQPAIQFVCDDIDTWTGDRRFTIVICSSTFEHLHPDCRKALRNIRRQLDYIGIVFIDFIGRDISKQAFEGSNTYLRVYSKQELHDIFAECGYKVIGIDECVIGESQRGEPVLRFVVIASAI